MSLRHQFKYRFDNLMSRGVGAQILLLAVAAVALILLTATLIVVIGGQPETGDANTPDSYGMLMWKAMTHTLDPGTLGNDQDPALKWKFLFLMLFVTIGGIFIVSALIGVLNNGFGEMIGNLRRGRSVVIETEHIVILGWTGKVPTLLSELCEANRHKKRACVVILADRDKVEMDHDVAETLGKSHLRVITRNGNPMSADDLELVRLSESRAVIVLAPDHHDDGTPMEAHESDTVVLKALMALAKVAPKRDLHIVAEVFDPRSEGIARLVAGDNAALILARPLISRLLVQTGRQSGLSVVYTELLDFAGVEIHIQPQPALLGTTFGEAIHRYGTSSLLGVRTGYGQTMLSPPLDRKFIAGDEVIVISEDEDTVILDGEKATIDEASVVSRPKVIQPVPERILVLGSGPRLAIVLRELDDYVAPGSEALVVGQYELAPPPLTNVKVLFRGGDLTDRGVLETLDVTSFDHILALSETMGRTQEMADARTMVTLLHLRDLERIAGKKVSITSEILDIANRDLATVSEADDFIVSNTLISLMVSQVAENPHLVPVFDELFSARGSEIYLKPATDYIKPGSYAFGAVCESALRRKEIAIGYRLVATANDPATGFGVVINPNKRKTVQLGADDKVIVLADS